MEPLELFVDNQNSAKSPQPEYAKHDLKKAVLIVNTRSRQGKAAYSSVLKTLREQFTLVDAHAVQTPEMAPILAERAVKAGIPLVIIGGGDGTLSACVAPFIGSDSVMGTLPLGTGNQFVRDLGLPLDIHGACVALSEGKIAAVDVGKINREYFLTVATIGITTRIARELTVDAKRKWGKFVYLLALLPALRKTKPFQITIKANGESRTFQSLQAVIGNGRFHSGPFPLAPDASITSGKLVVYALEGTSRWNLLRYVLSLPGGNQVHLQEIACFETSEAEITSRPIQKATVDGETHLLTPLKVRSLPGALRVIVPQNFNG